MARVQLWKEKGLKPVLTSEELLVLSQPQASIALSREGAVPSHGAILFCLSLQPQEVLVVGLAAGGCFPSPHELG